MTDKTYPSDVAIEAARRLGNRADRSDAVRTILTADPKLDADAVVEAVLDAEREYAEERDEAYGLTFREWLDAAGRQDSASHHDLRAAWRAGEEPSTYAV